MNSLLKQLPVSMAHTDTAAPSATAAKVLAWPAMGHWHRERLGLQSAGCFPTPLALAATAARRTYAPTPLTMFAMAFAIAVSVGCESESWTAIF